MAENNLIGVKIKSYKIVEKIGQGGNAVVYLARDEKLDRLVAIKMLYAYAHHPYRKRIIERFRRGAQAAARLQHPNILPVYDFGEWEKTFYIVMQYVPGQTLRQYLLDDADMRPVKPLPLSKALDITRQVGAALIHAHQRGIIHRDVKPSNIILEDNHVYLADFGLAHVEGVAPITQSGETLGTPHYMSPEQGRGLPIDHRSDIYSLAVVLYQMLTGQVPFHAETPMSVILKHMVDPLPPPRSLNPKIPVMIEVVLRKALSKNPSDRQQTMEEFIHQLEQATTPDASTLVGLPPSYPLEDDASSPSASFLPPMEQTAELPDYGTDTAPLPPEKKSRKWIAAAFLGGIVGVLLCGVAIFVLLGGIDLLGGATVTPAQLSALTPTPTAFTPTPTQTRPAIGFESPTSTLAFTSSPTKPPPSTTPTFAAPSPTSSATLTSLPTKTSTLTPTGTPTPRVTPTSPPLPSAMVLVPAGNFIQGSLDSEIDAAIQMCSNAYGGQCPHPREWFTDETPRRTVYLDAFYIDRWEVTNKQFAAFTSATAYQTDAEKKGEAQTWRTFNTTGRENYPAVWMSWNDADAYCTWAGKRLPSEAEWEKAARGDDARIWPWGSNWESGRANTGGSAVAVGSYSTGASPYGVMDMAGNVWEWVADWHDPNWYSNSPLRNPGGPLLGVSRVLRGGGFNNPPWEMRAAHRHSGGQDGYAPDHGFRCAR